MSPSNSEKPTSPIEKDGKLIHFIHDPQMGLIVHRNDGPAVKFLESDRPPLWYWFGTRCNDFDEWLTFATGKNPESIDNELAIMLKLKYG